MEQNNFGVLPLICPDNFLEKFKECTCLGRLSTICPPFTLADVQWLREHPDELLETVRKAKLSHEIALQGWSETEAAIAKFRRDRDKIYWPFIWEWRGVKARFQSMLKRMLTSLNCRR